MHSQIQSTHPAATEEAWENPRPDVVVPDMFDGFPVISVDFELEAVDPILLPEFSGASFRGLLGNALKSVACRRDPVCETCAAPGHCAYSYLFETQAPAHARGQQGTEEVSRPFIIAPPMGERTFHPGERFRLGLRLLGKGIDYLPVFVFCIEEMGRRGLGARQARFRLVRAMTTSPFGDVTPFYLAASGTRAGTFLEEPEVCSLSEWVYQGASQILARMPADLGDGHDDRVKVEFLSPTRLVHRGDPVTRPEFEILVKALLRRLETLCLVHADTPLRVDFPAIVRRARECQIVSSRTHWYDFERVSNRQGRAIRFGGIVGPVVYRGDLRPFLPLLAAGQFVHTGKATTFGMGRYELR